MWRRHFGVAEEADQLYYSGLRNRGIELYKESLKMFADAYCIQSRLAVNLASLGRTEEAARHYQKAYELMPDSFGRVETHCFGCEGIFVGREAQEIAAGVFTKLLAKNPEKPQLHYLMGQLREAQGQHEEAMKFYREAVRLDPAYQFGD